MKKTGEVKQSRCVRIFKYLQKCKSFKIRLRTSYLKKFNLNDHVLSLFISLAVFYVTGIKRSAVSKDDH